MLKKEKKEDIQEASISGMSLKIRIDNLQDEAKDLFVANNLVFAKDLLASLNKHFRELGLTVRFSDYTADLSLSYPAAFKEQYENEKRANNHGD
jgi:hypothetical protein